ncbi:hypothetical protein DOJK_00136 [Patescibacteria group bacterium]|nr:hypothetical protein DOJK_00136 [Patescibacteria group bacterium]
MVAEAISNLFNNILPDIKNRIPTLIPAASLIFFAYFMLDNFYVNYYWFKHITGLITILVALTLIETVLYFLHTEFSNYQGGYASAYKNFVKILYKIYSIIYSICLFGLFLYIVMIFLNLEFLAWIYPIPLLVLLFIITIIGIILSFKESKLTILILTFTFWAFSFLIAFFFYFTLVQSSSNLYLDTPLQGQNTIIMENIYYKNDIQIPITIRITGPKTDLSIDLYKKDFNSNLIPIDKLQTLNPDRNPDKITLSVNSILTGNALNNGKYNIFINTSNLTTGYYELTSSRNSLKSYSVNSFYLLNNRSAIS